MLQNICYNCSKKRSFRFKVVVAIFSIFFVYYIFMFILNMIENSLNEEDYIYNILQDAPKDEKCPIIVWWTPFTGDSGSYKRCGQDVCFFTDQRSYFTNPRTKAFLFYGSDFKPTDLPLPRASHHDWGLLHEESPKNNLLFSMERVMKLFNHTSTFRRHSDLPLTFQYLDSLESITTRKYYVPTQVKNEKAKTLAPLVYLHSDCNTPSERDSYVEELMKYIPVDSYGKCLQNKVLPPHLSDPMTSMISHELFELLAQYKFTLSIENAACDDYITEKLWRPLTVGSVPVYYGSPSVEDWLPNPSSAILIKDYQSPIALSQYLLYLLSNDTAYESHLQHKIGQTIANSQLSTLMHQRQWGINNDPTRPSFIDCFECMVCRRVAEQQRGATSYRATMDHYGCPKPVDEHTLKKGELGWWPELYEKAVYEALAVENLINQGRNFSATDFYQEVIRLLENSALT